MRRSTLSTVVALAALVVSTGPLLGFRMIQNFATGRVTAGNLVQCNDANGFVHWDDHAIGWFRNTANQGNNQAAPIVAALNTWSTVAGTDYNLTLLGTTNQGFVTDGVNTILWANGNGCTGGCLALTALVLEAGQRIVETDITFDNADAWNSNGADFDVQAVLTHELGHSLGFHHTEIGALPRPTMFATYFGVDGRTLEADDRGALTCTLTEYPERPGTTGIEYRSHVAGLGWLPLVRNGSIAGTTGQARQMEAAQVQLRNPGAGMGVCYQAHVGDQGWLGTVCNGATAGTTGLGRRMEAIRISLTGAPAGCNVEYRAHAAGIGWLAWVSNNAVAGTTGQSRAIEAIQVRLTGTCP